MHQAPTTTLEAIEAAARSAAADRARGLTSGDSAPEPSILSAASEHAGVEAVFRHRLRLPDDARLGIYEDLNHPLFPGAQHFRATRIQLSQGRRAYFFIGSYEAAGRLTFSVIAPCPGCGAPVPSATIDSQADFGDWLADSTSASEAPSFRTSPVHRRNCPLGPGQP
ncbi:hypothetical protein ACPCKW_23710 [Streptomyces griseoincarnatus]